MTEKLHEPLRIGSATIRNRLYRAPVLEGAGDSDDAAQSYTKQFGENARHGGGLKLHRDLRAQSHEAT